MNNNIFPFEEDWNEKKIYKKYVIPTNGLTRQQAEQLIWEYNKNVFKKFSISKINGFYKIV